MAKSQKTLYNCFLKRILDIIFSFSGIVLSLPLLIIAMVFIKLDSPGPVVFKQERVGYNQKIFFVRKLRTMDTRTHDKFGNLLRDRERVTKSGKIIRKLSLDELPQFINILKGDMSFVGPRPLLVRYLPYYDEREIHRHDVRPGITGLAQINGRGFLQWEERFEYDLYYVENMSFFLDIKILLRTIISVFSSEGTSTIRPPDLVDFDVYRQDKY